MGLETIINKHLKYTYDNGWRYEFWLKSEKRIVYGEYMRSHPRFYLTKRFCARRWRGRIEGRADKK